MGKTVLFSPVGGTDPISQDNGYDGSLLHICRVYQPDEVIMYMSQEVLEKQDKDDRYRKALSMLAKYQDREPIIIKEICRPNLKFVQEYDFFYNDFQEILLDIQRSLDVTDTLLLNVSSGTPAMKSGLLVLQNFTDYRAKTIQVVTPTGKMTDHTHDDGKNKKDIYDLEFLWEMDDDNSPNYNNRCREVSCPSFTRLKNEEIIKKHIAVYDYQAALTVAESIPGGATTSYYPIIKMAYYRLLLDYKNMISLFKKANYNCLPVRAENDRDIFEYTLNASIKYERKQYADFILSITPIIFNLYKRVLRKQIGFVLEDYCFKIVSGELKWEKSKLGGSPYWGILNQHYYNKNGKSFKADTVYSDTLNVLIQNCCTNTTLKNLCSDLRHIEKRVRNITAHQIIKVDESVITQTTGGFTGKQILDMIKELFSYTDIKVESGYWSSYDCLNEEILKRMG